MSGQNIRHIADLLIKHRQNTLSEEENKELQSWIDQNQQLFEELSSDQIFKELGEDYLSNNSILTTAKNSISATREAAQITSEAPARKIDIARWWPAAAIAVLLIAGSYLWSLRAPKAELTRAIASKENFKNDVLPGSN